MLDAFAATEGSPMRFDLRLFAAAVDAGSITRGAEAAHLALASASARIAGMEAALGVPLLERGRRGVVPTAAGRALLGRARAIAAEVERMRGELRAFSAGFRGEIRMPWCAGIPWRRGARWLRRTPGGALRGSGGPGRCTTTRRGSSRPAWAWRCCRWRPWSATAAWTSPFSA
ncbi:LysR family transcriptional regulator [Lichenibacterium dinghuense]|uniref:LysR family transcriptional regulator n=1 Tax=Lichenibacterium dinghuense TaxID=2895977 RepID=UPI001F3EEDC0|nr:LysR family transcriptional regulator [Lichenibacterium sp. 6Y81]